MYVQEEISCWDREVTTFKCTSQEKEKELENESFQDTLVALRDTDTNTDDERSSIESGKDDEMDRFFDFPNQRPRCQRY